jgi:arylsulfatase A-like enzyme
MSIIKSCIKVSLFFIVLSISACSPPVDNNAAKINTVENNQATDNSKLQPKQQKVTTFVVNSRPNVVLVMSDDQGWGDVGYNGNTTIKTPNLDLMSEEGIRMDRFYAAAPVCSPTRGSVLTGRHPYRLGIPWASVGHLSSRETTLAEVLKNSGYRTGHFGKWHVGEMSKTINQSYENFVDNDSADPASYSPPWENGFDVSFSTESMMPTYNPYYHVGGNYGTKAYRLLQTESVAKGQQTGGFKWRDVFWTGPGKFVDDMLEGDVAEIVMDTAVNFIEGSSKTEAPFLAVIWLHTPHSPLVASDEDRAPYADANHPIPAQHFYGAVTAMDRQIGRLRKTLRQLKLADNTLVIFNSDNGPSYIQTYNSAGHFSGKKGSLKEGGVRVPGIIEWPAKFKGGKTISAPVSTSDIYPTILAATGIAQPNKQLALDGINILPLLSGEITERPSPIAFQSQIRGASAGPLQGKMAYTLSDNRYKLASYDDAKSWQLYDLIADPAESKDLALQFPQVTEQMRLHLEKWVDEVNADGQETTQFNQQKENINGAL